MAVITLFPRLDEKETARAVREYLKEDYAKVCLALGTSPSSLRSPQISGEPRGTVAGNPTEDGLIKLIDLDVKVKQAYRRLERLNPPGAQLVYRCYLLHISPETIADESYRSVRYIHGKLQTACCQFASCLADITEREVDLRVWK
ncbi:hypothetical protein [Ligilactobacillus saerimneri]|uniref:hypothetical protein n=1 Tax=Ligilactobacillus saerimneri TaxID=228229 RepID=UPI001C0F64CE|nr:hypothetical protein [Ligilactobacillus saerimneri]MBU5309254.1 hypothetical protein [Ligilactobacillus saerimneri]